MEKKYQTCIQRKSDIIGGVLMIMKGKEYKLSLKEAHEMRSLKLDGWTLKDISEKYNVSISCVSRICRYESHTN